MSNRYFHFTLGPVQSFVAQARRTRDFWAGSFLLSWLSAVAIKAVEAQEGELLFPKVEDDYLAWLENKGVKKAPQQGCIPNRFKGGFSAVVPADFNAKQVVESVQTAWESLAEAVWQHDLENLKSRPKATREIWDRQVKHFWEISWALTSNENESNLLDRRKNWRSYLPPEEPGVKCMMMDGWQELSSIDTPNAEGLKLFWERLRKSFKVTEKNLKKIKEQTSIPQNVLQKLESLLDQPEMVEKEFLAKLSINKDDKYKKIILKFTKIDKNKIDTDLREGEYLCAIAFIKRRFSHVFHKLQKIDMQDGKWKLYGWNLSSAVPSVSYMAAAPWLAKVLEVAPEKELLDFHNKARELTESYGEYKSNLYCIEDVIKTKKSKLFFWSLSSLDGDIFFESALDNKNRHEDQDQAQEVKKSLITLRQVVNKELEKENKKLEPVSPFYAVLMMDGDSLGKQMSEPEKQTPISNALNHFTNNVSDIVKEHSGFLIYAGGDDVLALLPLEFALQCAYDLRQLYLDSFKLHGEGKVTSTLSGAIEYAHIKMPLGKVLGDAHHLLDEIAKDGCGRDSIAVRVWKPGGQHLQWAMPWKYATDNTQVVVNDIADKFRKIDVETPFSNSFFFNIEERFGMLQSKNKENNNQIELAVGFEIETIITLLAAEYLNSGVNVKRKEKITLLQAKDQIRPLIEQCMPVKRKFENNVESFEELQQLNIDAAHFIRFLVTKGVE